MAGVGAAEHVHGGANYGTHAISRAYLDRLERGDQALAQMHELTARTVDTGVVIYIEQQEESLAAILDSLVE